jgi:4-hydroxybenzoyl-CoA reductase subunit beta
MELPEFQFVEPRSIEESSLFLKDHGKESKVLGGGTDLLPSMKQGIFMPKYVVHLGAIQNLDGISFDERWGLQIGALTKLRFLETHPIVLERYSIIGQAVRAVGSVQLRQMGTVGGNLCLDTRCYYYNQSNFWRKCLPRCVKMGGQICNAIGGGKKCFAVFSGDLAPALMALNAKIKLFSVRGERGLLLNEFYTGDGAKPLAMEPEEILVGVEVPAVPKETSGTYLKYRMRKSIDFPLASVATLLTLEGKEKICREARVVIGAVGSKPEEVKGIGNILKGKKIENSLIERASELAFKTAKPIANVGCSPSNPSYRKTVIRAFVKRSLQQAIGESA